jgi:CRISPR system Cascade subunit CasE
MTLHLLRFDPDLSRAAYWFAAEGIAPRDDADDGYAWHALLAAVFGKDFAPKPFRLLARRGRPAQLLGYSGADAATLQTRAAEFAEPMAFTALATDTLASKPMPEFAAGRRLAFSARLRPTVRTDRGADRNKAREIDAFVAAQAAAPGHAMDRAAVYLDWTHRRLTAAGVEAEGLRIDGLDSNGIVRRGRPTPDRPRSLQRIPGHAMTVAGTLRVVDATAFAIAMARGLGRHRAFGYGMILLSPAEP